MSLSFVATRSVPAAAGLVAVGVTAEAVSERRGDLDWEALGGLGFEGKAGEVQIGRHGAAGRLTAIVGLGAEAEVGVAQIRSSAAVVGRTASKIKHVALDLFGDLPDGVARSEAVQAAVESLTLATYRYDTYRSEPKPPVLAKVSIVGSTSAGTRSAIERGEVVAGAVVWARDLVNEPGGSLTPAKFAQEATRMARRVGLQIKVMDEAAIKKAKLGGVLGVNRGSDKPPRFVELSYDPGVRGAPTLALVGKGITFDSGGLSIKTQAGMATMKCDMGGGAAVLAAMSTLPGLGVKCRVKAYVPMTDNMLGGDATRAGDVLRIRNGKTIEVLNTDAEGRLILADALSLASEAKPDAIIDVATLTGACMVALGPKIAGVMGSNEAWVDQVRAASDRTGERVWPLPLPADYRKHVDSAIADMKNIGIPQGGALTAGLILQEFVGDGIAWAHLDIAGPAWSDVDDGEVTKGGTGFAVRLLADLAANFAAPS